MIVVDNIIAIWVLLLFSLVHEKFSEILISEAAVNVRFCGERYIFANMGILISGAWYYLPKWLSNIDELVDGNLYDIL